MALGAKGYQRPRPDSKGLASGSKKPSVTPQAIYKVGDAAAVSRLPFDDAEGLAAAIEQGFRLGVHTKSPANEHTAIMLLHAGR